MHGYLLTALWVLLLSQVESEVGFGEMETVDLMANGGDIAVTTTNREQYVQLYSRYVRAACLLRWRHGAWQMCPCRGDL